jgi:hypothetical protein
VEPAAVPRRLTLVRPFVSVLVVVGLLAGCGDDGEVRAGAPTTAATDQRYEASATVLESDEHGPQLCLGGVADSYPPQCGGPDLVGWDWAAVDGEESANGTTWGDFHVVGTYVGGTLTLTEVPDAPQPPDRDEPDFTSPCPEPEGGWRVVDPALATDAAFDAVHAYVNGLPDHGGTWHDQSINPAYADGVDADDEGLLNDPTQMVLNVRFTGDLEQHEADLRERWGGPLCVSKAEHTEAELRRIQDELQDTPGLLGSGSGSIDNRVNLDVIFDDGSLQAELDERFGRGAVVVTSALQPVDP